MEIEKILTDMGYGGFAGFVVGFAVKKVLNVFLMLMGLYILSIMWLSHIGILDVNWGQLWVLLKSSVSSFDAFVKGLVRTIAFSGSFMVGFTLGFKTG
ncbi:FUN14 family protein [Thermocrinis albus DSM 14484]|uniref:FUN14 family protein n=1 Tax=Thermocrinis albus (strain DSM 14484 / JCM 11386 / HI 11/12) TaxID=638303 RepID=D3SP65_THEAH|nr:FUN14 domain-containing protein [Thermocrinis albus]ADC88952.1 FUN14 family protein [Thermocrinis albus DSM 14484]